VQRFYPAVLPHWMPADYQVSAQIGQRLGLIWNPDPQAG
jgi:hypothetical protein